MVEDVDVDITTVVCSLASDVVPDLLRLLLTSLASLDATRDLRARGAYGAATDGALGLGCITIVTPRGKFTGFPAWLPAASSCCVFTEPDENLDGGLLETEVRKLVRGHFDDSGLLCTIAIDAGRGGVTTGWYRAGPAWGEMLRETRTLAGEQSRVKDPC